MCYLMQSSQQSYEVGMTYLHFTEEEHKALVKVT